MMRMVMSAMMKAQNTGFVSRFKADQPATKYREKFGAHPWEADE